MPAVISKASMKLTNTEKARIKAQKVFTSAVVGKDKVDVSAWDSVYAEFTRLNNLVHQSGDMKGKRPQGAENHEADTIAATIATITTRGNVVEAK